MNDLVAFQNAGLPADPSELKQALQNARSEAPTSSTGVAFLKMGQVGMEVAGEHMAGILYYGAEGTEVQEGSEWVFNVESIEHGYLLRDGARVNAEAYGTIYRPKPRDLRPTQGGEQWKEAYKSQLVCVTGEDLGQVCEHGGDSGGVVKMFRDVLMPSIERQLDVDPARIYPRGEFGMHSYYSNKQSKEIYEATFKVTGWMSRAELDEYAAEVQEQSDAAPSAAPTPAPAEAEAPQQDAAPEPPAPQRTAGRRRSRAAS